MARNIKLRNSCGKVVPGPIPLHSAQFPEGLMGLTGKNFQRVSAANKLYDFVAHIIKEAVELKLVVAVENPRSSLFWMTRFWKSVSGFFGYTAHQACAYGGERPKWTVLAWNHPAFKHICLSCPGEPDLHVHKPWGLVHTDVGTHFSTSEETAYPKGLARAIARVFAEEYFQHTEEASLQVMRTVSNIQPQGGKDATCCQGTQTNCCGARLFGRLESCPSGAHATVEICLHSSRNLQFLFFCFT